MAADAQTDQRARGLTVDSTFRRNGLSPGRDMEKDKIAQAGPSPSVRALSPARALPRGFGGTVGKKELEKFTAQERQRQEVIFEFIDTERAYVNDLRLLVSKMLHPALEKGVLTKEDAGHLCLNIETLLEVNADLLNDLDALQSSSGYIVSGIGPTLLTRCDRFKLYAVYCAHYKQPTYEEMRVRLPKFAAFADDLLKGEEWRGVPLQAYLHKPVARICKYPLLLRELLKSTPDTIGDHVPLTEAHQRICQVVDRINERTRQVEAMRKLDEIEKSLDGAKDLMLAQLTRRFVREINCKDSKKDDTHLFLFNDLLLVARPRHKKGRYEAKKNAVLTTLSAQDVPSDPRTMEVSWQDGTRDHYEFSTAEEKISFRTEIQQLIATGKEEAKRKPVALHVASTNAQQATDRASGRGKLTRTTSDSHIKNQAMKPVVAVSPSTLESPKEMREFKPKVPTLLVASAAADTRPETPLSAGRRSHVLIDVGRGESSPRNSARKSSAGITDSPRRHKDISSISRDDLIKELHQLQNDKEMLSAAMAQMKADMARVTVGLKDEITSLRERLLAAEKERDELRPKAK